jgi:hypothetical protein
MLAPVATKALLLQNDIPWSAARRHPAAVRAGRPGSGSRHPASHTARWLPGGGPLGTPFEEGGVRLCALVNGR